MRTVEVQLWGECAVMRHEDEEVVVVFEEEDEEVVVVFEEEDEEDEFRGEKAEDEFRNKKVDECFRNEVSSQEDFPDKDVEGDFQQQQQQGMRCWDEMNSLATAKDLALGT